MFCFFFRPNLPCWGRGIAVISLLTAPGRKSSMAPKGNKAPFATVSSSTAEAQTSHSYLTLTPENTHLLLVQVQSLWMTAKSPSWRPWWGPWMMKISPCVFPTDPKLGIVRSKEWSLSWEPASRVRVPRGEASSKKGVWGVRGEWQGRTALIFQEK